MTPGGQAVLSRRLLMVLAIGIGLLGARQAVCRPCAIEAGVMAAQLAAEAGR